MIAEKKGLIKGPLIRDTRGGDFIDALGKQWDVKACVSRAPNGKYVFNPDKLIKGLKIDIMCGEEILLDLARLELNDYILLQQRLIKNLNSQEISKIKITF